MELLCMEYVFESPVGRLLLGFTGDTLTTLRLVENPHLEPSSPRDEAENVIAWLRDYFAGHNPPTSSLNYKTRGSSLQERVWKTLDDIPYGYCVTLSFLTQMLAPDTRKRRLLFQAVAKALACNPLLIISPCHRVIRSSGEIGEYAGGRAMKCALLKIEGSKIPGLDSSAG